MSSYKVHLLPVLDDNYIFIIEKTIEKQALIIDPALGPPVIKWLSANKLEPIAILNTHHHADHIGGNNELAHHYPDLKIYAPSYDRHRIVGATNYVKSGDELELMDLKFEVLFTPGHTLGHIVYSVEKQNWLFCGDLIFAMGCGRLFEGTPQQMLESLKKISHLSQKTLIFCAHEYTQTNGRFALAMEPGNKNLVARMDQVKKTRSKNQPTIPFTLEDEFQTNPFFRCDKPEIIKNLGFPPDEPLLNLFSRLRERRNHHQ